MLVRAGHDWILDTENARANGSTVNGEYAAEVILHAQLHAMGFYAKFVKPFPFYLCETLHVNGLGMVMWLSVSQSTRPVCLIKRCVSCSRSAW